MSQAEMMSGNDARVTVQRANAALIRMGKEYGKESLQTSQTRHLGVLALLCAGMQQPEIFMQADSIYESPYRRGLVYQTARITDKVYESATICLENGRPYEAAHLLALTGDESSTRSVTDSLPGTAPLSVARKAYILAAFDPDKSANEIVPLATSVPYRHETLEELAHTYMEQGNHDKSFEYLRLYNATASLEQRARIMMGLDGYEPSLELLESALEQVEDSALPTGMSHTLETAAALAYANRGMYEEAFEKAFERLVKYNQIIVLSDIKRAAQNKLQGGGVVRFHSIPLVDELPRKKSA